MADSSGAEKRHIYRNLVAISVAFLLIYSAYYALEGLQSSLNEDDSLGVVAVSFVYAGYFLSVIYASFVIDVLGTKKTLVGAFFAHTLFVVANFHPTWWTMVPASLLLGLVAAPQWTAQGVMVSRLALQYASIVKKEPDAILTKFTGIFGFLVFMSAIPGSLVSSLILTKSDGAEHRILPYNVHNYTSYNMTELSLHAPTDVERQCGRLYCPNTANQQANTAYNNATVSTGDPVTKTSLYIVLGVYLAVNLLGVLATVVFVKNVKVAKERRVEMLRDLVKLLRNPDLLAILVIVTFYTFSNSLIIAIFTNAFISCTLGVTMVGYGYACYAVGRSFGCLVSGLAQRCVHRAFHFILVYLMYIGMLSAWLLWIPSRQDMIILYFMSFIMGVMNGTIDTQTKSLLGLFFPHKLSAAFSLRCLADGLGHAVALVYMGFFCTEPVLYVQIGALGCSIIAYSFIEIKSKIRPIHIPEKDLHIDRKEAYKVEHSDVEMEALKTVNT